MASKVTDLFIYPVKSCQGIRVTQVTCTPQGIENDRRWAIVEMKNNVHEGSTVEHSEPWHVENQYEMHAALATIATAIEHDKHAGVSHLVLSHKTQPVALRVPIQSVRNSQRKVLPIGGLQCSPNLKFAEDEGPEAAAWLTAVLSTGDKSNRAFRLVWCPPDARATCDSDRNYGKFFYQHEEKAFTTTCQYHIMNKASLESLNRLIREKDPKRTDISTTCFRPNIIVEGVEAWDEDNWKKVSVGTKEEDRRPLDMRVCLPAFRCSQTSVVQTGPEVGSRDQSVFQALQKFCVGPDGKSRFGLKLNQLPCESREEMHIPVIIREGDSVTVRERTQASLKAIAVGDEMVEALMDRRKCAAGNGTIIAMAAVSAFAVFMLFRRK